MADWEDAPKSQWEDAPGWEDPPQQGALDTSAMRQFGQGMLDQASLRGRAALGGLEWAGSQIAGIPSFIGGGFLGVMDPRHGMDPDKMADQVRHYQEAIPKYTPQTEFGKVADEMYAHGREISGDMGGDSPALRTANELAYDITTMFLPGGRGARRAGESITTRKPPTPQEVAIGQAADAKKQAELRAAEEAARAEKMNEAGTQMEILMPDQDGPNVREMAERARERVAEEQASRPEDPLPTQADLFEPNDPSTFPGVGRSQYRQEWQQRKKDSVPYELSLDEPNKLINEPKETLDPFRKGDEDMPLNIEKLEFDPYFDTLKKEFDKHIDDYHRNMANKERADAYGQTQRYANASKEQRARYDHSAAKALEKANEALRAADDVWNEADHYHKTRLGELGLEGKTKYTGSMWERVDPAKLQEARAEGPKVDGIPFEGTNAKFDKIEKTPTYRTGTKGRRQGGSVDLRPIKEILEDLRIAKLGLSGVRGARRTGYHEEISRLNQELKQAQELGGTGTKGRRQGGMVDLTGEITRTQREIAEWEKRIKNLEKVRDTAESAEKQAKIDQRLERLYYDQMKRQNKLLALADPKHEYHQFHAKQLESQEPTSPFRGTAFRDRMTGKVYETGPVHDRSKLPPEVNKQAVGNMEAGFVTKAGTFVTRDQAAQIMKKYDSPDGLHSKDLGLNGPGKKQRGSIDFTNDPEFLKFKDSLPEPMKQFAKGAFREMKKIEDARNRLPGHRGKKAEVLVDQPTLDVLDNIPGLGKWADSLLPLLEKPEVLKERALKEPDIGGDIFAKLGHQLVSGAKILGIGTENTIVRYAAQGVDRVKREAQQFIEQKILDKTKGMKTMWEKLTKSEYGHTWTELMAREGIETMTREQMFDLGFSEKQVNAAEAVRWALDRTYDLLNKGREAQGKGPINYREGHIPSRFRGDFTVHIRDEYGNLVHIIGAQTKWGAGRIKAELEAKYPQLTFGEVKHEPLHRFRDASDATAGYQQIIDVLSKEDPLVASLEAAYAEFLKKQAYDVLGTKKHFLNKDGVKGAEGNKEWKDAYENAQEGIRSIMNFVDHAAHWSFTQLELKDVRTLLKDKDLQDSQKNAIAYSQAYIDQALGRTTKMARHADALFDVLAEHTGIGQSLIVGGVRDVKHFMTALYLGFFNAGFSLSQLLQVVQTQPALMMTFKNRGAEGSILTSYARGAIDATKGFSVGVDKMSVLAQQAWTYARDMGIVEPKILDDARNAYSKDMHAALKFIMTKSMEYPEKVARTQAYLTWVHFLHESGMKMGKELYEAAGQMTDITMVDYRAHERPMLYKQLGIIGEAANALTTFKHNYFSQAWMLRQMNKSQRLIEDAQGNQYIAAKDVKPKPGEKEINRKGSMGPEAAFYGTLLMMGGALSLPFRDDIDALIQGFNKYLNPTDKRLLTSRELMLMAPDNVSFGPLSTLSGLDLTSKFSAANVIPDDTLTAAFPFAGTLLNMGGAMANAVKDPSATTGMQLLNQFTPSSAKWAIEKYFNKNGITQDPNKLEGTYRRNGFDEAARVGAVRSMDESKASHWARSQNMGDEFYSDKRHGLVEQAKRRAFEGNYMALGELARKYGAMEGSPDDFINEIIGSVQKQHMDRVTRMVYEAIPNPQKLQRRMGKR